MEKTEITALQKKGERRDPVNCLEEQAMAENNCMELQTTIKTVYENLKATQLE